MALARVYERDNEREKEMEYFIGYAIVAIIGMMAATDLLVKWGSK